MSTTARWDITIEQGMPFAQAFAPEYYDRATDTLKRRDYTGYRATFSLWASPATFDSIHDTPAKLTLTSDSGAVELGLFDSTEFGKYGILLYLTPNQTSNLSPFGRGVYNLDVLDSYGNPQLRIKGVVTFEEGERHG